MILFYRCGSCGRDYPVPGGAMGCWADHAAGKQSFRDLVQVVLDGTRTAEGMLTTCRLRRADPQTFAAARAVARVLMITVSAVAMEAATKVAEVPDVAE